MGFFQCPSSTGDSAIVLPPPTVDVPKPSTSGSETAVLAGGCFWGVQGVFQHVKGVYKVVSGYAGGTRETANYNMVGSGRTDHAEAVEVMFDPHQVSFGQLLQVFFSVVHNPTELNRQGPDHGPQYRSAVFPQNAEQKRIAALYIGQLNQAKIFPRPIVTSLEDAPGFFPAEDYHQDYLTLNPYNPYVAINDIPKVQNLARIFPNLYQDKPVLVRP